MNIPFKIEGKQIGQGYPCFIIAEAGVNHNGSLRIAKELIDAAVLAGVDAVKFQTFNTDQIVSRSAPKAEYQIDKTAEGESQLEMLQRLELSEADHEQLEVYCHEKRIIFLSTPFDKDSVDLLERLNIPAFKIGSGELTNYSLLKYISEKGKPMILSTGMSDLKEVGDAVDIIHQSGNDQLVLLHCVSNYPADPSDVNLRAMQTMRDAFRLPVGYSDHTLGIEIPLAAVALGACVIEKHFTLDRDMPGPDHQASITPVELKDMVLGVRKVEQSLGHGRKEPSVRESSTAAVARRSLVAAEDITKGTIIKEKHIKIMRPGTGLPPRMFAEVIGKKADMNIDAGSLIRLEMLS